MEIGSLEALYNLFSYFFIHKIYVWKYGRILQVPIFRLIVHDLDKIFNPAVFSGYFDYYRNNMEDTPKYIRALIIHRQSCDHHIQGWTYLNDFGGLTALDIPENRIREMVADWTAFGIFRRGRIDTQEWFNKVNYQMNFRTRIITQKVIDELYGKISTR